MDNKEIIEEKKEDVQENKDITKDVPYEDYLDKDVFEDILDGIVYLPMGCVIDEKFHRKVELRKMKARDRLEMSRKKNQKDPMKTFDLVLNRCVLSIGGKPTTESMIKSLSTGDRDLIFIALRLFSIGETMIYRTVCGNPQCKEDLEVELSLYEIPITTRDDRFIIKNGRAYIKEKNERLGIEMEMRVPDNSDFNRLKKYVVNQDPELDYQLYKLCLEKWNDKEGPFSIDFILDLEIPQISWLESIVKSFPGPNWDVDITCEFCGSVGKINLGNLDFLSSTPV
jgi:hypothetical protein